MLLFADNRCRKDGNPFNATTISPSSPPLLSPNTSTGPRPPAPPFFGGVPTRNETPPYQQRPRRQADGPSAAGETSSGKKSPVTTKKIVLISVAGVFGFIILVLACLLFMPKCMRRRKEPDGAFKRHQVGVYRGNRDDPQENVPLPPPNDHTAKGRLMCFW